MSRKTLCLLGMLAFITATAGAASDVSLTPQEQLGKKIFFDENLSFNSNQACAACHAPESGWTGPNDVINGGGAVYEGSITDRFGNRKPPSSAYATQSPILHQMSNGKFVGGNFWDGRATGERLGCPAAEQALGPFLNPLEQALSSPSEVISRICDSSYSELFTQVCGPNACNPDYTYTAYDCVGYSVAAYEASPEVNQFSSKYDAVVAGKANFTKQEHEGFNLFLGKGKCNKCHTVNPRGKQALFTDYTYDNLGVPRNPENPFYYANPEFNPLGAAWIDLGLGGFLNAQMMHPEWVPFARENFGKHKVPTLRNVDKWNPALGPKVKAYGHNGYFKSLKGIVHFYNTRDVLPVCPGECTEEQALAANCWPLPEIALNMNTKELGNLGLSAAEEDAIVAFINTLSDGFIP
ncbi:MAG: cytochrome c peroxidase [Pseudomonadota bacterium]